jgi:hypothetical protein
MSKNLSAKILIVGGFWVFLGVSNAAVGEGAAPSVAKSSIQPVVSRSSEAKISDLLVAVNGRLNAVESAIIKAAERADLDRSRTSWFAFWTVIASGILSCFSGLVIQNFVMRHQRAINKDKAHAEVSNSYIEWQLKQLSELYGPLRALLGQSNAMYRQMNRVLESAAPEMFRLKREQGADFDNEVFEIFKNDQWSRFRTVKHLDDVYGKGYGVEPYFDDVVEVGARMANLMRDKAGYVQPSDRNLIEVMGAYLAHYAVLSRLHKRAKDGAPNKANTSDEKATFPISIQKLVNDGYDTINQEVMNWKSNGRTP